MPYAWCASVCLQTVSHRSVLSHFQNGVKCVGAPSLHGQRPFLWTSKFHYRSHMLGCGLLGLQHISSGSDRFLDAFSCQGSSQNNTNTEAVSLTRQCASCLSDLMRQVFKSINFYLSIYPQLLFVFSFSC